MQELSTLGFIILFTLIGSVFSLIGGIILLFKEKLALRISHFLASFAAGTLLGAAFFDLLPEAAEEVEHAGSDVNVFTVVLLGILLFFLLERFIYWFHHHHHDDKKAGKPTVPLIMLGDTMHNFIDGVAIAATFMVSVPLGIITTLAVAAHEIPQEIGDFGIMIHRGVKKSKILWFNVFSAGAALLGALITFWVGESIEGLLPIFLSLAAGFFIYIATSDLIPDIHHETRKDVAFFESMLLLGGVLIVWALISILHAYFPVH